MTAEGDEGDEAQRRIASLSAQLSACQAVQARLARRPHEQQSQLEQALEKADGAPRQLGGAAVAERELRARRAARHVIWRTAL